MTRRRTALALAFALGAPGLGVAATSAPAAAASACPSVAVTAKAGSWSTLANGVRLRTVTVTTKHGSVPLHEVDADLGAAGVAVHQTAQTATSAATVATSVSRLGGVVGVNGDFFHITTDGTGLSADGNVGSAAGPLKGYAAESPALSIVGGAAAVDWVHLAGSFTITQASGNAAPHLVAASEGAAKPVKKTVKHKKAVHHRKKRKQAHKKKHRKVVKRKRTGITRSAPVTATAPTAAKAPASTGSTPGQVATATAPVVTTSPVGAKTAYVPLTAMNDDQAVGTVLYTSAWGGADRSAGVPSGSIEIDVQNGTVTSVRTGSGKTAPGQGQQAIVVSGAAAKALAWVQAGDTVSGGASLVDHAGTTVGISVSGDAMLVQGGAVTDSGCVLDQDTSVRPRVAAGTDGGHLVLLVSDGDIRGVAGLTVRETAQAAAALGLDAAVNFDGGNSSQLVVSQGGSLSQVNRNSQYPARTVPDGLVVG